MRVLATSLFAALALMGIPSSVLADANLEIFQPNFKDPYSGVHDALLDIDVEVSEACVNTLTVQVHLPATTSGESNAIFAGPAFASRTIVGISTHNQVTQPAQASVSWDGVNTLTFKDFVAGQATGGSSRGAGWLNFNFDLPDPVFADPTAPGFSDDGVHVPLKLATLPNWQSEAPAPFINLVFKSHFTATTNDPSQCGRNPPGGSGDPIFSGFQGQQFQFHGLPDEHFNLVSSPDVQLNSHFVYLSSGKCDYNDTECFTHPGTYMDILGLSVADSHVKMVAGTHEQGLRVWVNDAEIHRGTRIKALSGNVTSSLRYHHNGRVEITTDVLSLEVVNSDMFMNIRAALNDQQLLKVGATKHTVTDHAICKTNTETHNHELIEGTVSKKYPVTTPLHGLIGQTWRNVKVCGRDYMGTVQDYLASDLFSNDYHYSYYKW